MLPGTEARARLKFACRIAEKAYLADQLVFVWLDDTAELQSFDELLWTFADRSFVPHEIYARRRQWQDTPVLLGCEAQPQQPFDVLLNLGSASACGCRTRRPHRRNRGRGGAATSRRA